MTTQPCRTANGRQLTCHGNNNQCQFFLLFVNLPFLRIWAWGTFSGMSYMQIIVEAVRQWLLEEGRAAEYLQLQQLFSLCHAGLLSRRKHRLPDTTQGCDYGAESAKDPHGTASPLGGTLVRLLNGCLAAAAALPEPALRRIAAGNIIAAFCRSALREAHMRGRCNADAAVLKPDEQYGAAPLYEGVAAFHRGDSSDGLVDVDFLDAAFSVLLVAVPRHPLLVSELHVMEVAWDAPAAGAKVEFSQPPEETVAAVTPSRATTQAGAAAELSRGKRSEPSGSCEAAGACGRSSGWQGIGRNTLKPDSRTADQHTWDADAACSPDTPDAKGLAEFFFSPDFQCLLAVGQLLYGTTHTELESSCGEGCKGDAGPLRLTKPRDPPPVPAQPAPESFGAHRNREGTREGRDGIAWHGMAGWGHQERKLVDSRRGQSHIASGSAEGEEPRESHEGLEWQLLVEELCEVPTLAQLCGAAAVMDIWADLVVCAAEGGEEAGARWLGQMADVRAERQPTGAGSEIVTDAFRYHLARGLDVDGVNVGGEMGSSRGLRPGVEDASIGAGVDATAAQRAMSQRCCNLLAAALRRQPETLMSSLPPQLLCVLAVRSREVRHELLTGIATTLTAEPASPPAPRSDGEASVTDPWVNDSQSWVQRNQKQQQVVGRLSDWFRVMGWDLAEMIWCGGNLSHMDEPYR
ncbi:hypothetical protein Vretimale_18471 [Volvox reticuliferus]|nr:hypothetical protein Vretimale_18471 [Volvox reticuliferus]